MNNIDEEGSGAASSQYIKDLIAGVSVACNFELQKSHVTPSASPEYRINFNITFVFKFTRRTQHPTTRSNVSARVIVSPEELASNASGEETRKACREKTRVAILEAFEDAYLPHFPYREFRFRKRLLWASGERDDLVEFSWREAWEGFMSKDLPLRGYKELSLELSVTVIDPYVWIYDPAEGIVFDKKHFCYACAVEIYEEEEAREDSERISCAICLQDISSGNGWRFPCKHVFTAIASRNG